MVGPAEFRLAARRGGGAATRERILEVAEALIDRRGMEGLRLSDVASEVGIRPPSIFAHFEGRDAIGDAVARRVIEEIAALFARVFASGGGPEALVRRGARAFAGHLHDHPSHARMLLRDLARTRDSAELDLSSPAITDLGELMERVLRQGQRAGVFREVSGPAYLAALEGALLARFAWSGFDAEGQPRKPIPRRRFQNEAEEMAMALLRP